MTVPLLFVRAVYHSVEEWVREPLACPTRGSKGQWKRTAVGPSINKEKTDILETLSLNLMTEKNATCYYYLIPRDLNLPPQTKVPNAIFCDP
jgi:hypothetical protein